jgi:hypothetical protein
MKRSIVSAGLAFVLGLVAGGTAVLFWMRSTLGRSESVHAASSAGSCLVALYPLQAGDTTQAVSRLETILDSEILLLGTMPYTETTTNELRRAKEYRTKYPWRSGDKGIDAAIQSILSGQQASGNS